MHERYAVFHSVCILTAICTATLQQCYPDRARAHTPCSHMSLALLVPQSSILFFSDPGLVSNMDSCLVAAGCLTQICSCLSMVMITAGMLHLNVQMCQQVHRMNMQSNRQHQLLRQCQPQVGRQGTLANLACPNLGHQSSSASSLAAQYHCLARTAGLCQSL